MDEKSSVSRREQADGEKSRKPGGDFSECLGQILEVPQGLRRRVWVGREENIETTRNAVH